MTSESLRLEWRTPAELAENPKNWRRHPENQVNALADVISEVGWAGACLFNEATGRLIDGHARRAVAIKQGAGKIPVLVGSWPEDQEAKILATLDPLAAMAVADGPRLDALLREVSTSSQPVADLLTSLASSAGILDGPEASAVPVGTDEEIEEDVEEDDLDLLFSAPYPYFGGKSRVAKMVWRRFGDVGGYVEPFFGSGAVMLNRPQPFEGYETINDKDGYICNFWRAVKADPDAVADYADWPVLENDLHARHAWLVSRKDELGEALEGDPEYFDARIAGWWVWGMACWIGSGFCSGEGPWKVAEVDGGKVLVRNGGDGRGVSRQRVHLGDDGQGVNRKRVHLVNDGQEGEPGRGERGLLEWMRALSVRLRSVRVCCGDWTRVCGGDDGNALAHFRASENRKVGIFLDPPYADTAGREENIYANDSLTVAHDVREWAIRHGENTNLLIALCGYEGEHVMPESWSCVRWKAAGGMAGLADSADSAGKINKHRERIWFSPGCLGKV